MRKIGLFSVLLALSFMMTIAVTGCSKINEEYEQGSMSAPTKKEVIKMLKRSKRYIYEQHMTRFALKAYGEKSLKKIEILDSHVDKVGNYDTNMRYWPVFAVFKVRYTKVDDKKVMVKFIMKYRIYSDSSGGYHLSNSAEVLSAKEM